MAHATSFIRRRRHLGALPFLVLMVLGKAAMKHPSLASMVDLMGAGMSREALHQRFTQQAERFMDECLKWVLGRLRATCVVQTPLLRIFKRVMIVDSTGWEVAEGLAEELPGSGGSSSTASCKLQVCLEYLSGQVSFLKPGPGNVADNTFGAQLPMLLQAGDLLLADLGYFCIKRLRDIADMGAFFLTRLHYGTTVYNAATGAAIDLCTLLTAATADVVEMQVLVGARINPRLNCRLVCLRLSPQNTERRKRALRKTAASKSRTCSAGQLLLAQWTLLLTNVPQERWPAQSLWCIYSLRWQIELLFKRFKSVFAVHQTCTANIHRLRCELYGKLILCVLTQFIHATFNNHQWNVKQQEVSADKLAKRIQERLLSLAELMLRSPANALRYLRRSLKTVLPNCAKYQQPSRRSSLQAVLCSDAVASAIS
jgi:hypothetical protein